jgi:hypothetical protein
MSADEAVAVLSADMRELLEIFNRRGVEYLVVGGHAVSAYAEPRATKDLDVLVSPRSENALRVFGALEEFGAPLAAMTSADFEDEESFFVIGVKPNRVDILKKIPGLDFDSAWARRKIIHIDDLQLSLPCIGDLFAAKMAAGRPQDLLDASKLRRVMTKSANTTLENRAGGSTLQDASSRGRYKLNRQVGGRGAFSEVGLCILSVGPGSRQVAIGESVEAWIKNVFGAAAIAGVNFAIDHADVQVEASVLIDLIVVTHADSTAETVAFAAAHATWRALKARPTRNLTVHGVEVSG